MKFLLNSIPVFCARGDKADGSATFMIFWDHNSFWMATLYDEAAANSIILHETEMTTNISSGSYCFQESSYMILFCTVLCRLGARRVQEVLLGKWTLDAQFSMYWLQESAHQSTTGNVNRTVHERISSGRLPTVCLSHSGFQLPTNTSVSIFVHTFLFKVSRNTIILLRVGFYYDDDNSNK
jgi:hypothetical protein